MTGFFVTDVPDCLDRDRVRVEPNATYRLLAEPCGEPRQEVYLTGVRESVAYGVRTDRLDERVRIREVRSVAESGRLVPAG